MTEVILMDTGPLVAFFDASDRDHSWARAEMDRLPESAITCEPVLTKACFLLARGRINPMVIIQAVKAGTLRPTFELGDEAAAIETLISRYKDTPMSLADACLVRLSELHKTCRVFTLDRHFRQYKRYGRSVIPLLAPW